MIEGTDFSELPNAWRSRTRRTDGKEFTPGRRGKGADWLYYDHGNVPRLIATRLSLELSYH